MKKKARIVLTGGGTGGHIYPALAIAGELKRLLPEAELSFIGTKKGLEKDIIPHAGYHLDFITAAGMERKLSWQSFVTIKDAFVGFGQALILLKKIKPDLVIGTGGYVSGPVVLAAAMLKIPTAIHEQNAYPGVTNKILNPMVGKVFLTFPKAKDHFRRKDNLLVTGLPVRSEIMNVSKTEALAKLGIPEDSFVVTVVGGSRGARSINQAMPEIYRHLQHQNKTYLIHVTGENEYQGTLTRLADEGIKPTERLRVYPYLHEVKYALVASNLIVGRAGASFLSEILVLGIPAILIPYPFAAENHQYWNAMSLVEAGAARVIEDKKLNGGVLLQQVLEIMHDRFHLQVMHQASLNIAKADAVQLIGSEVLKLLRI